MDCEICGNKEAWTREYEGLQICKMCALTLGFSWNTHTRSLKTPNIHMNGCMAADPRPYGRLPGHGF